MNVLKPSIGYKVAATITGQGSKRDMDKPGHSQTEVYENSKDSNAELLSQADLVLSLPSITGQSQRHIKILLVNPNFTSSMTQACLDNISSTLPTQVTIYGFTAPPPSPLAIESQLDQVISTSVCMRAVLPISHHFDAFLVACFSAHPLISALREQLPKQQPVIGIMEASLYAARICGKKLGIVTSSERSAILHARSVESAYGLGSFSVGCEASKLGVLELESKPREYVNDVLAAAAKKLVEQRGVDCVCLGCAGMTDMQKACQRAVKMDEGKVMVIDGVGIGVQILVGLVREGLRTARP